jgi:hypothetical protein
MGQQKKKQEFSNQRLLRLPGQTTPATIFDCAKDCIPARLS